MRAYILVFILFMFFISFSCTRLHQKKQHNIEVPNGWVYSPNNAFVKYIEAKENKPGYELVITRPRQNEQLYFVNVAESIFPDQKTLQQARNFNNSHTNKTKNWYFERLWWASEYQGYKIPFSLTSDCINYYIAKYADVKKGIKINQKDTTWRGSIENRVLLQYIAEVKESDSKKGATTVSLKFKWYYYCGQTCGWGFTKERLITFSSQKNIVKIEGDTPADIWVATEQKPYAPDQWITF